MNEMDIIIITKNSAEPCLNQCLSSIADAADFKDLQPRLIVIDGESTDGTLDIVNSYQKQLDPLIILDQGNRATARQKGLEHVETDLFAFIDSDVVLTRNWFKDMMPYFENHEVGAVWGAALHMDPKRKKYFEAMAKLYGAKPITMMRRYGEKRGCLHDTMIRKTAIEEIKIPPELHVMEDHYIRLYIEERGWKWVSTERPHVRHFMGEDHPRNAYMDAYYGWKLGVYDRSWYIKHMAFSWAKLAYLLLETRDLEIVKVEMIKEWQFLKATMTLLKEALY